MKYCFYFLITILTSQATFVEGQRLSFSFDRDSYHDAKDGRLIVLFSDDETSEPRFQLSDGTETCQAYGMDVEGWLPGANIAFNMESKGYPLLSLEELPKGEYIVQAVFHVYETFHRSDDHIVKLPMDNGEGQQWNKSPGNLYSTSKRIIWDNSSDIHIALDQKMPPIEEPSDTKYVKHIKIRSELLSKFWGRDMYLGAHVLLPEGWGEHKDVRYPLAVFHGHFPADFGGWRTTPPDADLKPVFSERFQVEGYNKIVQQEAYDFYKLWTGPDFPRVLVIQIQHANPYYDDSYAVNSANLGPYGDAITYELIPYIEEKFRGIGEGWARFTYGGSTGGW